MSWGQSVRLGGIVVVGLMAAGAAMNVRADYATGLADLRQTGHPQAAAGNGSAMTALGDINGDGYADFGVGVPGDSLGGTAVGAGSFSIYLGHPADDRPGASGILRTYGTHADMQLGASIAGVGDVNGDGRDDYLVGAPGATVGGITSVGRAFLYFGRVDGASVVAADLGGTQGNAAYGSSVAAAGDVNGDGYADVLVGAPYFDSPAPGGANAGQVLLYFGGPGAFDISPDAVLNPTAANSRFGFSASGVGDMNGDSFADFVVGVPKASVGQTAEGAGLLYLGGPGAFDPNADLAFESNQANAEMGTAAAGAGDVNGDGYSDVALGAPFYDNGQVDEGAVFVYHDGAAVNNVADVVLERDAAGASFGAAIAAADSNGDGYGDLVVGAPAATDRAIGNFGTVWMFPGSASGVGNDAFNLRGMSSTTTAGRFGSALSFADYNADGFPELFVGAPTETGPSGAGQGFSYLVRATRRLSNAVDTTVQGTQGGAQLGHALATGDLNGDGYADVAVGLVGFDTGSTDVGRVEIHLGAAGGFDIVPDAVINGSTTGGKFGDSVAIGDFNRDGYGDLVVGAPAQGVAGEAVVYRGGPGAFNVTADVTLTHTQAGARLGDAVANAGDLNGDGAVDLIVGAPGADVGASVDYGVAYLYPGGNGGPATSPANALIAQAPSREFGINAAGIGDVNGDGIGDVGIAGMTSSVFSGSLHVWFGGRPFDGTRDQVIQNGAAFARFGIGLANAGDVNGDGYSDVVVGAPTEETTFVEAGKAEVFYGGASGLNTTAGTTIIGPALNSHLGEAVAGAGDVDADGYADVLVGVPDQSTAGFARNGVVRLYRGAAAGLVTASPLLFELADDELRFGAALALSDLNGDGFADPVFGAPGVAGGSAAQGAFAASFLVSEGRSSAVQQFRNPATPLDVQGDTESTDAFFVVMDGYSPHGRERAKLGVEACPSGVAWGSSSCVRSTTASWIDTTATAGGGLMVAHPDGLVEGALYRWRARMLYAPYAITTASIVAPANPSAVGPWRRMRGSADIADLRVLDTLFKNGFE